MLPDLRAEKRFPASVSVGVIPFYESKEKGTGILLGQRFEDGMISPISGDVEKGERPIKALAREWTEETSLSFGQIELSSNFPITTVSPQQDKTSVALLYLGKFNKNVFGGFPFYPVRREMTCLDFYGPEKLRDLLVHYKEKLFRPDLNFDNLRTVLYMLSNREGLILDLYKNSSDRQKLLDD